MHRSKRYTQLLDELILKVEAEHANDHNPHDIRHAEKERLLGILRTEAKIVPLESEAVPA